MKILSAGEVSGLVGAKGAGQSDYFNMPAKVFAKVWASPGHLAET
jgi:hypothetical protein